MKRPSVKVSCVADRYHMANERIVEFTFPDGKGGLISFRCKPDGAHIVEVYRMDDGIRVFLPSGDEWPTNIDEAVEAKGGA